MKRKKMLLAGLACAFVIILVSSFPGQVLADGKKAVVWSAGEIKWSESPALPGAKIAPLWGDPSKEAYGALKSIPGGSTLKLHTHSHDQKVVIISGTFSFTMEGGAPKELSSGSYIFIPAEAKHVAECKAGADCVWFEESPAASNIKYVVEVPKK